MSTSNPTQWINHECPHCYTSVKLNWEYPEQAPENIFCPNCGVKEELDPLDFDNVDFEEDDDIWDE